MKILKKYNPAFCGGIASGLLIAIGGTVLLSVQNRVIGAILFTVALLSICKLNLFLFTGRVGFCAESFDAETFNTLIVGLLGNFLGATLTGLLMRAARPQIIDAAVTSCLGRLDNGILDSFLLGCFCGVLMYVAVKIYKGGSVLGIIFCIPVFILAGFEHSIADMFYFALAGMINPEYIGFILAVIFGNSVGSLVIAALWRFSVQSDNQRKE